MNYENHHIGNNEQDPTNDEMKVLMICGINTEVGLTFEATEFVSLK